MREQLNRTFYERFFVDDDPLKVADEVRRQPFDDLGEAYDVYTHYKAHSGLSTEANYARSRSSSTATPASSDETPVLANIFPVGVSSKRVLVELRGFEPLTFSEGRGHRAFDGSRFFSPQTAQSAALQRI
ncbi:MAG: Site-specific recombinase [Nocardioides sp.]|nr:Site-specific recombinase [Nocardioides sp.]